MAKTPANVLVTMPISHYCEKARWALDRAGVGYGVELSRPDEIPPAAAEVVHELRAHPAGVHALAMFRDHRR
ncbi:MAG: hypothetical protein QOE27_2566 [Solirubrobacteraceae bacterium]|nr:hypothetical protein [Solirubrobacteraceae bacterium]